MQIDRLNHLQFPPDRQASLVSEESATRDVRTGVPARPLPSPIPANPEAPVASGVRLQVGGSDPGVALYHRGNPRVAPAEDDVSPDAMARRYQQAMARLQPDARALSVDAAGILVAKPRTAFSAHESDFVALAVSAMRDFRDSAEHAKAADGVQSVQQPGVGLRDGLAQLAARLKAFA